MIGSAQAVSKTDQAGFDAFVERAQKDLRAAIEGSMPVVYLVDVDQVLRNLYFAIGQMDQPELDQYLVQINTPEGVVSPTDVDFMNWWDEIYNELVSSKDIDRKILLEALDKKVKKTISIADLAGQAQGVLNALSEATAIYSVGLNTNNAALKSETTSRFQSAIRAEGKKFRTYIRASSPAFLENPQTVLNKYDPSTQRIIIVDSYSRALTLVNEDSLTPALHEILKRHKIIPKKTLTAGSFTAAGHAAAISGTIDNVREVIGINTPLTQSTLLLAQQTAEKRIDLESFVRESGHVDTAIQITENYSKDAKTLLSIGFSFLISMETEYNSITLRNREVQAMDSTIRRALNTTVKSLRDKFFKKLVSREGLENLKSALRLSPTMKEAIELQMIAALTGKAAKAIVGKGNAKKRVDSKVLKAKTLIQAKSVKSGKAKTAPTKPIVKKTRTEQRVESESLVSLQRILDQLLVLQVKQNMGGGGRTDILNLRTGRFAESVKVERLSQSREGMITAFYSYMKNPYATFSAGGRQELPRSRDPKLLIGKSIREILQSRVQNRLRAVPL